MVVAPGRDPVILTGPENQGTARRSAIDVEVKLYPPFGLLGQDRSRTPPLADLLRDAGIAQGAKVGVVGWKYFGGEETATPEAWIEIAVVHRRHDPVDRRALRAASSTRRDIFMDGEHGPAGDQRDRPARAIRVRGMRTPRKRSSACCSAFAPACASSRRRSLMRPIGLPLNCHPMLSAGERATLGLASPSDRVIERGDPFTMAFGLSGALTARAGFAVADESELPDGDPRLRRSGWPRPISPAPPNGTRRSASA